MNFFQLIKWVLDRLYHEIDGDDTQKDDTIRRKLECLSKHYNSMFSDGVPKSVDYGPPEVRFAYIFGYTCAHASYVHQLIEHCPVLSALFEGKEVEISCIGGGPGSDFLGILKYMIQEGKRPDLYCNLYDKEQAWGDNWNAVAKKLGPGFRVYANFLGIDVTSPNSWKYQRGYLGSDLVTIVYFVSEVLPVGDATTFFEHLFKNAKQGTIFLFIDIYRSEVYEWFDCMAESTGLIIIDQNHGEIYPTTDEQKSDLQPYIDKFDRDPKLKSRIAYRIAQKP